jgi:predicted NAD/FAD-dependent oxidoreductase
LIEKSRGVGGRCATRRVHGQPVDHGIAFYHGGDPGFIEALEDVDESDRIEGWPRRIVGHGRSCQPRAFDPRERRIAFASGVNAFPKRLASGLEIRCDAKVTGMAVEGRLIRLETSPGVPVDAPTVVLAIPAPQALALLPRDLVGYTELAPLRNLLAMVGSVPCLTVLAGYSPEVEPPAWDIWYPEESDIIRLISHDSSKRRDDVHRVLVLQGLPAWSKDRFHEPDTAWSAEMLGDAAHLLGDWACHPVWTQSHRWRYAMISHGDEFVRPVLGRTDRGSRIGICGEAFAPGGGVQAAWRSGRDLARRLAGEE